MKKTSLLCCFVAIQVVWASANGFAIAQDGTGVQIPGSGGSGPTNSGPTPNDPTNWGDPPPTAVGLCAYELIGASNGVWYYTTCTCVDGTPTAPYSFGQSTSKLTALGCTATGCSSGTTPASNSITETSIEQVRNSMLGILANPTTSRAKRTHVLSLVDNILTAEFQYEDLVNQGRTAEADDLKFAVLAEWKKHVAYLRVMISGTEFQTDGVSVGRSDLPDTEASLLMSLPTSATFSVDDTEKFRVIPDEVVVVTIPRKGLAPEKRYFQLFHLKRRGITQPDRVRFGQQIQPVTEPEEAAKIIDLGRFTHVIEYDGQTFQVNSFDDLKALSGT
ncbi:MAG: hypothetical protein JNM43_11265 [Planctomycetaceae bacterium]|nr:hypothetical protein [Planctomycetaceae bacterium]